MPKPIDINDAFINAQFQDFVDFAQGKDAGTKVRAVIGGNGQERTIAAKSESVFNKIFFRAPSNKAVNNEVRTLFRQSVARMFGGEDRIPASVKKAMKLDDYGKGRPLTARRILAVQSALAQIAAKHDECLRKGLDYCGDRANGLAADRVKLAFASCHGNADAMDIVEQHLGTIIESGEGDLRSEQQVQKRVEGLVANLEQLKALSRKNPAIYAAGKQLLVSIGKPVPRAVVAGLVQAANRAPLNLLRRLDEDATGMQLHKALRQFHDTLQGALDSSGAGKKLADDPSAKTAAREFVGMILLSRCSASALGKIRDALNSPTNAHLYRLYGRYRNGERDGLPGNVSRDTLGGLADAGEIAANFMEMLAFCVHQNLERTAPGGEGVEIGECNGIPDLPALGGDELVGEILSMARDINARHVDDYVNATVTGRGPAADDAKRLIRNKLGEANNPVKKLGARLGANAGAMMNLTVCGEMQKFATGQQTCFERDIARGLDATLRDGGKTIKLSNDFTAARDELARFVTGDDNARYDTLQKPARNKVHLLMALLSQETGKAGDNGTGYTLDSRESQPGFEIGAPRGGTGRATRTFTIEKKPGGGISLLYEMDKQISSFEAHDRPGEDHSLAPDSNFKCLLNYSLAGDELERVADLDYSSYDDDQISSVINETEKLEDGTVGCKKNALSRAVDAMPEKFRIDAECTLDFTLNLVPAANP